MSQNVCRICLRTDFSRTDAIDKKLTSFYEEICDFYLSQGSAQFCGICEYRLRKFYNFRLQCWRAFELLKNCGRNKHDVQDLKALLPPSSIGFLTPGNMHVEIVCLKSYHSNQTDTCQTLTEQVIYTDDYKPDVINQEHDYTSELKYDSQSDTQDVKSDVTDNDFMDHESDIKKQDLEDTYIKEQYLEDTYIQEQDIDVSYMEELDTEDTYKNKQDLEVTYKNEQDLEDTDFKEHDLQGHDSEEYDYDEYDSQDRDYKDDDLQDTDYEDTDLKYTDLQDTDLEDTDIKDTDLEDTYLQEDNTEINEYSEGENYLDLEYLDSDSEGDESIDTSKITNEVINKNKDRELPKGFLALKRKILELIERGEFKDLDIDKDMFLKMFEKVDKTRLTTSAQSDVAELKKYLMQLIKKMDPKYEEVFDIQYLTTTEEKIEEFRKRKFNKEYQMAPFKCKLCYKAFECQQTLDYHNKWHDPTRKLSCNVCLMRFRTGKSLRGHMAANHYTVYRCRQCPCIIYFFPAMLNHYQSHQANNKYACDQCPKRYKSRSSLSAHRISLHASWTCAHCARRFVSHLGLNVHTKLKHDGLATLVRCEDCKETFTKADELSEHVRLKHPNALVNRYKCQIASCGLRFATLDKLKDHRVMHRDTSWAQAGPRPEVPIGPNVVYRSCPICDAKIPVLSNYSLYKHHKKEHAGLPYVPSAINKHLCEQCGKTFKHQKTYLEHLNMHAGHRPYACPECPARFAKRGNLSVHRDRHRPPRFACDQCGKRFITSANLYQHTRIHAGERKFVCKLCGSAFVLNGKLTEHMRGVHLHIRRPRHRSKEGHKIEN